MPCDVCNPLLGLKGSAYVYGPQKGVKFDDLPYFDTQMENIIRHYLLAIFGPKNEEMFNKVVRSPGTGASGGLVAALLSCFDKANIISGMDFVNNVCNLEEEIKNSEVVLTGEGSIDQ
jgi:glycerate kinase